MHDISTKLILSSTGKRKGSRAKRQEHDLLAFIPGPDWSLSQGRELELILFEDRDFDL